MTTIFSDFASVKSTLNTQPAQRVWRVASVRSASPPASFQPQNADNQAVYDSGNCSDASFTTTITGLAIERVDGGANAQMHRSNSIRSSASASSSFSSSSGASALQQQMRSLRGASPTRRQCAQNTHLSQNLSALTPPAPSPLRRCCGAKRDVTPPPPPRPEATRKNVSSSAQFSDHFVRRMDEELARIRERPVEVKNDKSKYTISLDMNIFRAEDIQLCAESGRLVISAQREVRLDATRSVVRVFTRTLSLPVDVATDALATRLSARGLLTITMLKHK